MSKVIVVGDDPTIPGRIARKGRTGLKEYETIEIEVMEWAEFPSVGRKHASAVVLDVSAQDAKIFGAVSRLKSRSPQLALLFQMTSRQMNDKPWSHFLTALDADFITHRTSKSEVQSRLQRLLARAGQNSALLTATAKPGTESSDTRWQAQNGRRIELIYQQMNHSLSAGEQAELAQLQEEASRHVNRVAPLPFEALAEFEASAQRILARQVAGNSSL